MEVQIWYANFRSRKCVHRKMDNGSRVVDTHQIILYRKGGGITELGMVDCIRRTPEKSQPIQYFH